MKTLTVKVPEMLDKKLEILASQKATNKSTIIREALEKAVDSDKAITDQSCLDLARDLSGSAQGPGNLLHHKKYLKGYGQ